MYHITVDTTKGPVICPVYDPAEDLDQLDRFASAPVVRGRDGKILNVAAAFDIETTNIMDAPRPYSFMYHWQFCIGTRVFFGRTWDQFIDFVYHLIERLQLEDRRLVVYVHNLAFEFQFMRRFFRWDQVFLRHNRDPLKAICNDRIIFRDSYALSNMRLEKFCENTPGIVFAKNDGEEFNYKKIRTPETKLTQKEQSYCYCDVAGLCECIRYKMREDHLGHIPMTSTGYVRRDFRSAYAADPSLRVIWSNNRLDPETYQICRWAFRGGDTHASNNYVGLKLEHCHSRDISSSYPAAMLLDLYPVTKFTEIDPRAWLRRKRMPKYAALLLVRFENIEYIGSCGMPYIAIGKCQQCDPCRINDNGRVLKCGPHEDGSPAYCTMWITDIDLRIIEQEYKWTRREIARVFVSKYGPLPEVHKEKVMEYFRNKTTLKGVAGKEYEYGKAKQLLNSSYGMMVTDIAKRDWEYKDGEYVAKPHDIAEALDKFYRSRSNFLSYQQGVWITCNSRFRLRKLLWKLGPDVCYCDTDSIKYRGDHDADFEEANKETIARCLEAGYYADDPKGRRHYLGTWEEDGDYAEFKSLGAKRYIVRYEGDDHYYTTIAGVNKKRGQEFFDKHGIDAFRNGVTITNAGHVVAYYNDDQPHYITVQGVRIRTASNVCLVDDVYTMGITNEYNDIIQKVLANITAMN